MRYQRAESPALLNSHQAASRFFAHCFKTAGDDGERLWVAHVDHATRCHYLVCYPGELESVDIPIRDILRDAVNHRSAGVVLAHNHPGGDARPSDADCRATRKLVRAAEALGVAVLDHLIFAGDACWSMRRNGLL